MLLFKGLFKCRLKNKRSFVYPLPLLYGFFFFWFLSICCCFFFFLSGMDFFLQADSVSSPPSSPPYRPLQRQRSSYIVDGNNADAIKDKVRLDYMYKVKNTFQHLSFQQKYTFLTEILDCCDNQLLQYIYTFITPKLKIDFLKELPIELSLYVVSFIQDPLTLARASRVSRHWNQLTKDENAWKALCLQHQYISTPSTSYRDFFRRRYNIDTAWNQGGHVTFCQNEIGDGLATSLQMDDTYIVIGCDNNHIEVYNAKDGKHIRSLLGHEGGVWAIQFIKNEYNEHILVTGGCDRYFLQYKKKMITRTIFNDRIHIYLEGLECGT